MHFTARAWPPASAIFTVSFFDLVAPLARAAVLFAPALLFVLLISIRHLPSRPAE
jgi:hypothetical protein